MIRGSYQDQNHRVAVIIDVPEDGAVDVVRGVLAIEGIRDAGTEDHHEPHRFMGFTRGFTIRIMEISPARIYLEICEILMHQ